MKSKSQNVEWMDGQDGSAACDAPGGEGPETPREFLGSFRPLESPRRLVPWLHSPSSGIFVRPTRL